MTVVDTQHHLCGPSRGTPGWTSHRSRRSAARPALPTWPPPGVVAWADPADPA